MKVSLNKMIAIFHDIATNHEQIKTFGVGDMPEIVADRYPLFWVVPGSARLNGKILSVNWKLIFADIVDRDESNENEVLSDTLQIATDVRALLQDPIYEKFFRLSGSANMDNFTESDPDNEAGWTCDITTDILDLSDRCAVPLINPLSAPSGCPDVTIKDEEGNVIANIEAGGIYIVSGQAELEEYNVNVYVDGVLDQTFTTPQNEDIIINIS